MNPEHGLVELLLRKMGAETARPGPSAETYEVGRLPVLSLYVPCFSDKPGTRHAAAAFLPRGAQRIAGVRDRGGVSADSTRLLTVNDDDVELTHKSTASRLADLHSWVEADRAGLLVPQQLEEAANAWQQEGATQRACTAAAR